MNNKFLAPVISLFLLGCGKSDVDKCVDAQMEAYRECKSAGKEQWCQERTELDRKAQMHFACLKMSAGGQ
jgi:hypothetical protein